MINKCLTDTCLTNTCLTDTCLTNRYKDLIYPNDINTINVWFNINILVDLIKIGISNINFHTDVSNNIITMWTNELKKVYDIYIIVYHKQIKFLKKEYKTLSIIQKHYNNKLDINKYHYVNIIDMFVKDFVSGKKRKYYYIDYEYMDINVDLDIMNEIKYVLQKIEIFVTFKKDDSRMFFFETDRYLFKIKN